MRGSWGAQDIWTTLACTAAVLTRLLTKSTWFEIELPRLEFQPPFWMLFNVTLLPNLLNGATNRICYIRLLELNKIYMSRMVL